MAETFMAYPELRHPFEVTPIHPEGSTTVLYQGKTITLSETGQGEDLLINPEDLTRINGFELKPEGACYQDMCIPIKDDLLIDDDGKQWFNQHPKSWRSSFDACTSSIRRQGSIGTCRKNCKR